MFLATTGEAKATERIMSMEAWRGSTATVTTASARMAMVSLGRVVVVMVIKLYLANFVFFAVCTIRFLEMFSPLLDLPGSD